MVSGLLPSDVGDIDTYAGDELNIKMSFTDSIGRPVDVTASEFTATFRGGLQPAVDMSYAAIGVVKLTLSKQQTEAMLPMVIFDVEESGAWNRTLVRGRLVRRWDVL